MRRALLVSFVAVIVAGAWACAGDNVSSPATPTSSGGGGGGGVQAAASTITIAGNLGSRSFTPNPASIKRGTTVAWLNNDSVTHHIVMDDGSFETGDIPPGASSDAFTVTGIGGTYHCAIHPSMVGSINATPAAPSPCPSVHCGPPNM